MFAVIIFIIILGVLIFVHELGHFLIARRNGIKADEFGFGFPPRIFGFVKKEKSKKYKFILGNKDIQSANTVYSLNWIPLGGFVRIKGENGEEKQAKDSFASKSAWTRVKVLAAGVVMNFILAAVLLAVVFMLGAPQAIEDSENVSGAKVQIAQVVGGAPAEEAGIMVGDEIAKACEFSGNCIDVNKVSEVQDFVNSHKGENVVLSIQRGKENLDIEVSARADFPEDQGPLGVALARTALVKYPWYQAIFQGVIAVFDLTVAIFVAFFGILKNIFSGAGGSIDVAGPVGIAFLTKQVSALGFVYILQFAAILSINLGIINGFPFPALDGGRILFIIIEKIKGSPVSQKVEHMVHTIGILLLISLMVLVTFKDIARFF